MNPFIALLMAPLVYAACGYPSGIGKWHPKAGQTFELVVWELGITTQLIQALNPAINIDKICPEFSYNVTIKTPRTGEWIAGCPPSLVIEDADSSPIDSTTGQLETPKPTTTLGDDKHKHRSTRTISITTTIYQSGVELSTARPNTSASSVATHEKLTGPLTPSGLTTGTIITETTQNLSVDDQGRGTGTEVPISVPSSITDTARSETTASSTSSAACTLPQTKDDGDTKIEKPSVTSSADEQSILSEDISASIPSEGASMGLTTTLTTDDAIATSILPSSQISTGSTTVSKSARLAKDTSTLAKSANTDATSDQTVPTRTTTTKVGVPSHTGSTVQTGKESKSTTTASETTLVTSPSKAASETTTTANPYNGEAEGLAICFYNPALFGFGETDSDKAWSMIDWLCETSNGGLILRGDDKCDRAEMTYASRVNYLFQICQKEDCPSDGQSLRQPFGENGLSCTDIFYYKIWHWCNEIIHYGNGGSFDLGCLNYSLTIR